MTGSRLARWGRHAEDAALVLLLSAMIVLAALQIVLRNGFDEGIIWADEALRLMVLWLALAGAVAASRADRHISINVLARFLPPRGQTVARIVTNAFTAAVCGAVAWYAFRFVSQSYEFEDELLGGLPAWWFQAVMPVAFALMAWRYFVFLVVDVGSLWLAPGTGTPPTTTGTSTRTGTPLPDGTGTGLSETSSSRTGAGADATRADGTGTS